MAFNWDYELRGSTGDTHLTPFTTKVYDNTTQEWYPIYTPYYADNDHMGISFLSNTLGGTGDEHTAITKAAIQGLKLTDKNGGVLGSLDGSNLKLTGVLPEENVPSVGGGYYVVADETEMSNLTGLHVGDTVKLKDGLMYIVASVDSNGKGTKFEPYVAESSTYASKVPWSGVQNVPSSILNAAPSDHTHNYAGADSSGGPAYSANYLEPVGGIFNQKNNTLPYHLIAQVSDVDNNWIDDDVVVLLNQYFVRGRFGIVKLSQRTNDQSSGANGLATAQWLSRNKFNENDIIVAVYQDGNKTSTDFFLNTTGINYYRGSVYQLTYPVGHMKVMASTELDDGDDTNCYASLEAACATIHGTGAEYTSITYSTDNISLDYLPLTGGTVSGTLTLSKTQDLSGTANNSPALLVGGTATQAHIEIDANEIHAKKDGTTPANLYINTDPIKENGKVTDGFVYVNGDKVFGHLDCSSTSRITTPNKQTYFDGAMRLDIASSSITDTSLKPPSGDGHILTFDWDKDSDGGWNAQLAIGHGSNADLATRAMTRGVWGEWKTVLNSGNYSSYITTDYVKNAVGIASTSSDILYLQKNGTWSDPWAETQDPVSTTDLPDIYMWKAGSAVTIEVSARFNHNPITSAYETNYFSDNNPLPEGWRPRKRVKTPIMFDGVLDFLCVFGIETDGRMFLQSFGGTVPDFAKHYGICTLTYVAGSTISTHSGNTGF